MSNERNKMNEKLQIFETTMRDTQSELDRLNTVLKVR